MLVVGFAWYERTHPTTRVIALVATLAAMAALGRVAFAALPNVKPTTDIVLIAGYVLGGAPGSWSARSPRWPATCSSGRDRGRRGRWSAWGGVGLFGAGLARVAGRELGRVPLAARLRHRRRSASARS